MSPKKKHRTAKREDAPQPQAQVVTASRMRLPNPKLLLLILLGVTMVMFLVSKVLYLPIPFDRDEGAYGYLGWMALSGGRPYIDFYEMKPPLLFYTYAVFVGIFGKSAVGLHLCALLLNLLCTWFVYRLGALLWKSQSAGVIAAIVFYLVGMHPFVTAYSMQAEHVVLVFALSGLLCTLQGASQGMRKRLFWGGVLLSCSVLVKQTAIFFCAAGLLMVLLYVFRSDNMRQKRSVKDILYFAAGGILPVALCLVLLLMTGSLKEFWYWIFEHSQDYVTGREADSTRQLFHWSIDSILSRHLQWFVLAGVGLVLVPLCMRLKWRDRITLIATAILSLATVTPGLRFYGHYWLCALPALAFTIPAIYVGVPALVKSERWKEVSRLCIVLLFLCMVAFQFFRSWDLYYQPNFEGILRFAHPGNYFYEYKEAGDLLKAEMGPGDQLMVFGSEPELYLYTNRKAPTRHFYISFTSKSIPRMDEWQQEVKDDINKAKPEYLVMMIEPYTWGFAPGTSKNVYEWAYGFMRRNYSTIAYVEMNRDGRSAVVTGPEARNYSPSTQYYMMICKRNQ